MKKATTEIPYTDRVYRIYRVITVSHIASHYVHSMLSTHSTQFQFESIHLQFVCVESFLYCNYEIYQNNTN